MSLRTVALETPRPRERAIVCDPTGWAVVMCSSTMARRIAALRSSSSIGTRFYRVPVPTWSTPAFRSGTEPVFLGTSRYSVRARGIPFGHGAGRQQEADGHFVAEEPAATREDGAISGPVQETEVHELVDAGGHSPWFGVCRRKLDPGGGAQRQHEGLVGPGRRGRGSRSRPRARCPRRRRRGSARACARSTPAGPHRPPGPRARGRRSRSLRSPPPASRGGCAGTPRPAGPSSTPRTSGARRPRTGRRRSRT